MVRSSGIVLLCGLIGCFGLSCAPGGVVNALTGEKSEVGSEKQKDALLRWK